ncbi:MAG: DUF2680 domain-containing protein, partial [Dethiobacter sp.]|nr:DUF2680 domain-containing protein [Dethiobacter sp.]
IAVPVAMASLADSDKAELEGLYRQQHQLRLQILQKQADFGLMDQEQAAAMRERMEQQWKIREQKMAEGDYFYGRMGRRGGFKGFRQGGGCGNCPVQPQEQSAAQTSL